MAKTTVLSVQNIEILAKKILKEWERDCPGDEYNTIENAREAARAEIRANKEQKLRGEALEKPKKRERKLDAKKVEMLTEMAESLNIQYTIKGDAEFSFEVDGVSYTVKLVKHRPPKP